MGIRSRLRSRSGGGGTAVLYNRMVDDTVVKPSTTIAFRYSDSLLPMRNDTGSSITSLIVSYKNRVDSASIEFNIASATTVRCSVDYLGTRYLGYTTKGGATRDLVMSAGGEGLLYIDGLNIPNGASFSILTFADNPAASHPSGLGEGSGINGGTARAFRSAVDATDYTASGSPAWSGGTAYSPYIVYNNSASNPSKTIGIFGDSQLRGSFTSNVSLATIAAKTRNLGFINCAVSGMRIQQTNNVVERLADMVAAGVTDLIVGFPVNDLETGRTFLQIQADYLAFFTRCRAALPNGKIVALTCPPRVVDASAPGTVTTTPAGAYTGGASSIRALVNDDLIAKAGTTNWHTHCYDLNAAFESAPYSGLYADPATNIRAADGLHYTDAMQASAGALLATYLQSIGI